MACAEDLFWSSFRDPGPYSNYKKKKKNDLKRDPRSGSERIKKKVKAPCSAVLK